jgi:hypothetical protein
MGAGLLYDEVVAMQFERLGREAFPGLYQSAAQTPWRG